MHLTNYAVNKKNESFVAAVAASGDNGEDASKWCLAQLRAYLTSMGALLTTGIAGCLFAPRVHYYSKTAERHRQQ